MIDKNNDGIITDKEIEQANKISELESKAEKSDSQKKMAWVAIISIVVFTGLLYSPLITVTKITAISELIGMFYISLASVVGAYMGFTSWMSK